MRFRRHHNNDGRTQIKRGHTETQMRRLAAKLNVPYGHERSDQMDQQMERPDFVTDEHLEYLDELRESGDTNMFGARPYLMLEFPDLSKDKASRVLAYWMKSFSERHAEK